MINLNECKFGDRLMTKGGDMVLFLYRSYVNRNAVVCSIKTSDYSAREIKYHSNGKRYHTNEPSENDIVGRWEELIADLSYVNGNVIIEKNEGTINIT